MIQHVEAVYEHGMLRPLEPIALMESQRVSLTISDLPKAHSQRDLRIVERARAEAALAGPIPTIEEVRAALKSIPGSLSEDVIAERGDYWLAQYSFDTSAVVKYYHAESGTPVVSTIFAERGRPRLRWKYVLAFLVGRQRRCSARLVLEVSAGHIEVYEVTGDHFLTAEFDGGGEFVGLIYPHHRLKIYGHNLLGLVAKLQNNTVEVITEFDDMIHLPVNDPFAPVITGVDTTYVDNPFLSEMRERKEQPEE